MNEVAMMVQACFMVGAGIGICVIGFVCVIMPFVWLMKKLS